MKSFEDFYAKGYEVFKFDSCNLNSVIQTMTNSPLKEGFQFSSKYSKTADLRPNVIDYDPIFMEVLKKNQIKKLIRSATLRDLTLFHVQLRLTNSQESYMDWHRDTYFDHSRRIGMAPPGVKIIYYPQMGHKNSKRLLIAEGTHRKMKDVVAEDLKQLDASKIASIEANDNEATLFDTSILHSVVPDEIGTFSFRLIYSFVAPEQIKDDQTLHLKTSKMYEEMF